MALQSKTIDGSTNHSSWDFKLVAIENSTSTSGNSSSLTVEAYIGRLNSASYITGGEIRVPISVTSCSSQTISGTYTTGTIAAGSWYKLGSKTFTVPHGDDGSKSVTISATFSNDVSPSSGSASGSMTLTKINRFATITDAPNFTDENNPVIKYSNPAGNALTIQACITDNNGNTQYAKYRNISSTGSSYTFNLTDAERAALIDAIPDGTDWFYVRFYIKSLSGSTTTGLKYLSRKFSVTNANPELDVAVKDIGSYSVGTLTHDDTVMIKGFNHMYATMAATLKKTATIKSQSIKNGDKVVNTPTGEFPSSENGEFIFSLTDSFGHTVSKTINIPVIPYVTLTCNVKPSNPTADGDMAFKITGNYFNDKFGEKGENNTLTVQWRIKENNDEYGEWISTDTLTPVITDNTYSITVNLNGLNYRSTYTIQAIAKDMINTSGILSMERTVRTIPVYNWGEDNFDINVDTTVDGNVIVTSEIIRSADFVNGNGEIEKSDGYYQAHRGYAPDIDTALTHGHYAVNTSTTGLPTNSYKYGMVEVIESRGKEWDKDHTGSWITQIFRSTSGNIYTRIADNGNFTSWHGLAYSRSISLNIEIDTTGYLTDGGGTLVFFVPLSKPIIGNPTITISSNAGFVLRQNGSYTHGSASGTHVLPASYRGYVQTPGGLVIKAAFSATTNATSRDSIGIGWSGIITLS